MYFFIQRAVFQYHRRNCCRGEGVNVREMTHFDIYMLQLRKDLWEGGKLKCILFFKPPEPWAQERSRHLNGCSNEKVQSWKMSRLMAQSRNCMYFSIKQSYNTQQIKLHKNNNAASSSRPTDWRQQQHCCTWNICCCQSINFNLYTTW